VAPAAARGARLEVFVVRSGLGVAIVRPSTTRSRWAKFPERVDCAAMYYPMFLQMKKTLGHLDKWMAAAGTFAKERSFDPNQFLDFRLAPDQFSFVRQVRSSCDTAKLGASRLTGKEAPVNADDETTMEALHARVRSTIAYLDGFTAKDFEGAATRVITQPRWEGKVMTGADYFLEHAVPNFYFHTTHAYALLRSAGVAIGKRDFLGALTQRMP
jgi:hypothetical protein